ncbi:flagellar hook assembly protein FlgD [Acerihabitans arboris]|uniref:Basal-body rod modification protein FlgD n=1 Tax=Acerihabitans arboris TaxID=2691583 RepID=A0A845SJ12_9GAMM|nr:flagellar hook assembly protein FlgD [Acerihabitans arboris]NDL62621.1 flagellar hook assembly protein FlgD [Acerihabitans arboris]
MGVSVSLNDPVDNTTATTSTTSTTGTESSSDLQSQFLTLLVAQLQNQDPTNPMDNAELTTQLAQISTLSGIENLNTTLGSISTQLNTSQSLQASTLVGHGVMIDGTDILVGSDSSTTPFGLQLDNAASDVTVTIKDASGNVVRTVDLGAQTAGVHTYSWDGTDDTGTAVAEGSYTFSLAATSSSGASTDATALKYALVYGVSTTDGVSSLNLGLAGNVTLDKVQQII